MGERRHARTGVQASRGVCLRAEVLLLPLHRLQQAQCDSILLKLAEVAGLLVAAYSETALVPVDDAERALNEPRLLVVHRALGRLDL